MNLKLKYAFFSTLFKYLLIKPFKTPKLDSVNRKKKQKSLGLLNRTLIHKKKFNIKEIPQKELTNN